MNHTVLVQMQQALGVAATAPEPASAESAAVPSPRKKATAKSRNSVKTTTTEKPAAKRQPAKNSGAKTAQPTLVDSSAAI